MSLNYDQRFEQLLIIGRMHEELPGRPSPSSLLPPDDCRHQNRGTRKVLVPELRGPC